MAESWNLSRRLAELPLGEPELEVDWWSLDGAGTIRLIQLAVPRPGR